MRRTPASQSTITCTECGARDAIEIELALPDDTLVSFFSCHRCENRWWSRENESIEVETVLKLVRKQRKG